MAEKKFHWHKLANTITELPFPETGLLEFEVGTKRVCLAKRDEEIFACAAKCPHAGGRLADGFVDGMGNIVCPLHRYRFSLSRGNNVSGEGYYLKTYTIEHRADGIYIGFEAGGLFDWLK